MRKIVIVAGLCLLPAAALANGCNGVVNQFVWGCAAWDHNNGPQYPNWRGAPAQGAVRSGNIYPGSAPILSTNGSNVINGTGSGIVHPPTGTGR